ncbi:MAG: TetR/AcrR family transcriptional regulator [Acidimicrobiia bacterium]|nr:TetR/AcrR family transcriptional regulator [Acidimicrobiia bacterium]
MTTRRERLRAETIEDIKAAALEQIARDGAPSLSLRRVARDIGMSPAGLYRYYDGRDDLLTDLITDAYTDLAVAVESATAADGRSSSERFAAGVRSYRAWALAEPNRFLLIFGTPIPGYEAPQGGPTVEAHQRVGQAFFAVAAAGIAEGSIDPVVDRTATEGEAAAAAAMPDGFGIPPEMIGLLLGTWSHWHGLVSLEVNHQFDWIYPGGADEFFEAEIDRMLAGLGIA